MMETTASISHLNQTSWVQTMKVRWRKKRNMSSFLCITWNETRMGERRLRRIVPKKRLFDETLKHLNRKTISSVKRMLENNGLIG